MVMDGQARFFLNHLRFHEQHASTIIERFLLTISTTYPHNQGTSKSRSRFENQVDDGRLGELSVKPQSTIHRIAGGRWSIDTLRYVVIPYVIHYVVATAIIVIIVIIVITVIIHDHRYTHY
jgi:hypothetical protein